MRVLESSLFNLFLGLTFGLLVSFGLFYFDNHLIAVFFILILDSLWLPGSAVLLALFLIILVISLIPFALLNILVKLNWKRNIVFFLIGLIVTELFILVSALGAIHWL